MHSIGVLGLSVARSEIDTFVQKDTKQTIIDCRKLSLEGKLHDKRMMAAICKLCTTSILKKVFQNESCPEKELKPN